MLGGGAAVSLGSLALLLSEFDREIGATRRVLVRVPGSHLGWRPHERSMTLGRLTTHIASLPGWLATIVRGDTFDLADVAAAAIEDSSIAAAIARFEDAAADARRAILDTTDARLLGPWTLRKDGHDLVSAPRIVALRTEGLYHLTHHRGQLTVYLRLLNVPLPPIYGPTADEGRL
jgi:uncharacterized damage-inducible protein DinB